MDTVDLPLWPEGSPPDATMCREDERLRVFGAFGVDSLLEDRELDAIAAFAARLCDTPVALVSLVDEERQRFIANHGTDLTETPRSTSFCAHAMLGSEPLVVPDAKEDPRFSHFSLVQGEPFIRFYAGFPLISREGAPLGSLCVIDNDPRPAALDAFQMQGMAVLAKAVMRRLQARRSEMASHAKHEEEARRFAMLSDNIPDIAWSCDADGRFDYFNQMWREFTHTDPPENDEGWQTFVHPEDREEAASAWESSIAQRRAFQSEYRMKYRGKEWRWVLSRARPLHDADGNVERWFGTITDIHEARLLSEGRDLLARELSHRIKNIFAVISGLVALTTRKRPELGPFAQEFGGTIRALGRAHDFVRPDGPQHDDKLHGLLSELFAPYNVAGEQRISVTGEDFALEPSVATPLALVFHELATNASKYGALGSENGNVDLHIERRGDDIVLRWSEHGGPSVSDEVVDGFGSRLIVMSIEKQMRGRFERHFAEDGLLVEIVVPAAQLEKG